MAAQKKSWWDRFRGLTGGVRRIQLAVARALTNQLPGWEPKRVQFHPIPRKTEGDVLVLGRDEAAVSQAPATVCREVVQKLPVVAWTHRMTADRSLAARLAGLEIGDDRYVYVTNVPAYESHTGPQ